MLVSTIWELIFPEDVAMDADVQQRCICGSMSYTGSSNEELCYSSDAGVERNGT